MINLVTTALVSTGAVFACLNLAMLLSNLATKRPRSMVGPVGSVLIVTGLFLDAGSRHLAWVGILIDPGMWTFAAALPGMVHQIRRSATSRLEWAMAGRSESLVVDLRLFRPDHYEITFSPATARTGPGWVKRCSMGTWKHHGDRIEMISHTDMPTHPCRCTLAPLTSDRFTVVESTEPGNLHDIPELPSRDLCLLIKAHKKHWLRRRTVT